MIRVIRVLAWISPADMHFARGHVNDQGVDRFLAIQRVSPFDGMIADRVRQVDMVFLNRL